MMEDEGPAIVGSLSARPETHRPRLPSQLFCDVAEEHISSAIASQPHVFG